MRCNCKYPSKGTGGRCTRCNCYILFPKTITMPPFHERKNYVTIVDHTVWINSRGEVVKEKRGPVYLPVFRP